MQRTIRSLLFSLAFSMFLLPLAACNQNTPMERSSARSVDKPCGTYRGHQLYIGPRGGCYYFNSNGKKSYIDREHCGC